MRLEGERKERNEEEGKGGGGWKKREKEETGRVNPTRSFSKTLPGLLESYWTGSAQPVSIYSAQSHLSNPIRI